MVFNQIINNTKTLKTTNSSREHHLLKIGRTYLKDETCLLLLTLFLWNQMSEMKSRKTTLFIQYLFTAMTNSHTCMTWQYSALKQRNFCDFFALTGKWKANTIAGIDSKINIKILVIKACYKRSCCLNCVQDLSQLNLLLKPK